jgi:hypothetical protein
MDQEFDLIKSFNAAAANAEKTKNNLKNHYRGCGDSRAAQKELYDSLVDNLCEDFRLLYSMADGSQSAELVEGLSQFIAITLKSYEGEHADITIENVGKMFQTLTETANRKCIPPTLHVEIKDKAAAILKYSQMERAPFGDIYAPNSRTMLQHAATLFDMYKYLEGMTSSSTAPATPGSTSRYNKELAR